MVERLKPGDVYQTKPQIASAMIAELMAMEFQFELVLAASLYGDSGSTFIRTLASFSSARWHCCICLTSWTFALTMVCGCHKSLVPQFSA
jgi:hypothetical protein